MPEDLCVSQGLMGVCDGHGLMMMTQAAEPGNMALNPALHLLPVEPELLFTPVFSRFQICKVLRIMASSVVRLCMS